MGNLHIVEYLQDRNQYGLPNRQTNTYNLNPYYMFEIALII